MQKPTFSELGLSPAILKAVAALGFEEASPIQAATIPLLMEGKDLVGQSQTGSGKTAAFAIPAIEKVDSSNRAVQALILCPTRELATQVANEVHKLATHIRGFHAVPIYGGASYERQFAELKRGVQIVIGTPGRLMDHLDRGTLKLDRLKMVILDEADRMLDMGFRDDIQRILESTPEDRQTVFFSATVSNPIRQLIKGHSRNPEMVKIAQKAVTVPTVEQFFYEVRPRLKAESLIRLIDYHGFKSGIIFCNTQRMVDDLADILSAQGIAVDRLHGGISQAQRTRVMNKFKKAGFEFLVATDVAGRGIDIEDLEVVVNYDLPYDPEDYVHRIGRTGRAGRKGMAATFVSGREIYKLQFIERFTRTKIRLGQLPTLGQVEEKKTDLLRHRVRTLLERGEYRTQEAFVGRLLEQGFNSTEIASALVHLLLGGTDEGGRERVSEPQEPRMAEREPRAADGKKRTKKEAAPARPEEPEAKPNLRKASRGMAWIRINVGRSDDITPRDLVEMMTTEANVPPKSIGIIELEDSNSYAQVAEKDLERVVETVSDMALGDRSLTASLVQPGSSSGGKGKKLDPKAKGKPVGKKGSTRKKKAKTGGVKGRP